MKYKFLTLQELLEAFDLYEVRRAVQLILARSVLLLLQGPWVGAAAGARLALEKVSIFCKIENGMAYPSFGKVFISTYFESNINAPPPRRRGQQHPFVDLLALGIMIGEIEHRQALQGSSTDTAYAKMLSDKCKRTCGSGSGVSEAMNFCIERNSFAQHVGRIGIGCPQDDQEFIQDCYNNIVKPLERDLKIGAKWSWDEITWTCPRPTLHFGTATAIVGNVGSTEQSQPYTDQNTRSELTVPVPIPQHNQTARIPPPSNIQPRQLDQIHVFDAIGCVAEAAVYVSYDHN